jgi:DNA-binding NarL/FixJ family response regulator
MASLPTASAPQIRPSLSVSVCASERFLLERICAVLTEGGHEVSRRVVDPSELARGPEERPSDVLVIGARRPTGQMLAETKELRADRDEVKIVLVCERSGAADVRRALESGIDGIVLTEALEDALADVVSVVCAGQLSVPSQGREGIAPPVLTTREKQLLGLVLMQMTNAQIAAKLFLAESTVKSHLSSAFTKLGVSSRNEAVRLILDPERGRGLGILTIPAEPIDTPSISDRP